MISIFKKKPSFTSYSQSGQDVFAYYTCATDSGTFLDIGAANPVAGNNSYGLECKGWSGLTIDVSPEYAPKYAGVRKVPLTVMDMTKINWDDFIAQHPMLKNPVDYLSFDIDEASLVVLRTLPFDKLCFRAITIEHDAYRRGDRFRGEMRQILQGAGYELLAADVIVYYLWKGCPESVALDGYLPFEDWYVKPELVDMAQAEKFRANNKMWSEILASRLKQSKNVWSPL
jgi:hypothetical protein